MGELRRGESAGRRHLVDERSHVAEGGEIVVFDRRGEVVARICRHKPVGSLFRIQVAEGRETSFQLRLNRCLVRISRYNLAAAALTRGNPIQPSG